MTSHTTEQDIHRILSAALGADEAKNYATAIDRYLAAVEAILRLDDTQQRERLNPFALRAMDRAEELKGVRRLDQHQAAMPQSPTAPVQSSLGTAAPKTQSPGAVAPLHQQQQALGVSGSPTYTDAEKKVLEHTSRINQHIFVPFMHVDLQERFVLPVPFTDRDGSLALAPKQRADFAGWRRISELHAEPQMIANNGGGGVSFYSIKQTVVSDCSVVASLAVAALYERRHGRRLITSIIWPRNRRDEPIYNASGKYSVRLHVNGVPRKVIIDDQLPVGRQGQLLCSYSSNRGEFWVSLLEKAYMKLMGGYDFPGSNSNIDLHALTGWIPERIPIRCDEADFNADATFERLRDGLAQGRCLITCATGQLSDEQADRTGLVATHAYAVLDLRTTAAGVRLLQLKNPWSHLRWKGNYSELDAVHWTAELREQLAYDPAQAALVDNGVFWIDYRSILNFFDVFYVNWNPALFQYTYSLHQMWSAGVGPQRDAYTIGDNQQYRLAVGAGHGSVWVLLTRHITAIEDFRENREYITLLVYKNGGKRVYYPNDPRPFIDGVRINSPHYLCKIRLDPGQPMVYTLVVSQYEKTATIYYTLRAYCRDAFELRPLGAAFATQRQLAGEWTRATAGGSANHPATYARNPRFALRIGEASATAANVVIELRGPKAYPVGLEVRCESLCDSDTVTAPFVTRESGPYRPGFCVLDLEQLPAGRYVITVSTFLPDQLGPFLLNVKTTARAASVEAL